MMQHTRLLLGLALSLSTACRQEPRIGGVSLECTRDSQCTAIGADWRCVDQACVRNTPPQLTAIAELGATERQLALDAYHPYQLGAAVTLEARFADADGDLLAITWTAASGPALAALPAPVEDAQVTLALATLGVYTLAVEGTDPYGGTASATVHLVAQPSLSAIYVSQLGSDAADCGTVNAPCQTITAGLARLPGAGPGELLLAAAAGGEPYRVCLDLDTDQTLRGCFDPFSWERAPALLRGCRVECDDAAGHALRGGARLEDVVLSIADGVAPRPGSGELPLPLTTLWLWANGGASPTVEESEIMVPSCGNACFAAGVVSVLAAPELLGVDVRGTVEDYEPLLGYIGVAALGGAPLLRGLTADESRSGTARGRILLNAPTTLFANGVLAAGSAMVIEGVEISGGPVANWLGVLAMDSPLQLTDSQILLAGFGTRSAIGVTQTTCANGFSPLPLCDCTDWLPAADCTGLSVTPPTGEVLLRGNSIAIDSASPIPGAAPCFGVGVLHDTAPFPATIEGNTVTIGANLTAGVGVELATSDESAETSHLIEGNSVSVADATIDYLCLLENLAENDLDDFAAQSTGLLVWGSANVTARDNDVAVGVHEWKSRALLCIAPAALHIEGNRLSAGASTDGVDGTNAVGAQLTATRTEQVARFVRNQVRIGGPLIVDEAVLGGATTGVALDLSLDQILDEGGAPIDSPRWEIANNTFFAGDVPYATAALFTITGVAQPAGGAWPVVRFNTFHGGGTVERGLTSTAVVTEFLDSAGRFSNNLLDAGNASGRKLLLDNRLWSFMSGAGNLGQFAGRSQGPLPILGAAWPSDGAPGGSNAAGGWATLFAGTGELVELSERTAALAERRRMPLGARPLAAWSGRVNQVLTFVIAIPGALGVSQVSPVGFDEFGVALLGADEEGLPFVPCAVAMWDADGAPPQDLVFVQGPSGCGNAALAHAAAGLFVMRGKPLSEGGGFRAPEKVSAVSVTDPTALDVSARTGVLYLADDAGATRTLYALPAAGSADVASSQQALAGRATRLVAGTLSDGAVGSGPTGSFIDDLSLIVDGELTAYRRFESLWLAVLPTDDECPGAAVATALAIGNLAVDLTTNRGDELAVACSDGTLKVYRAQLGAGTELAPASPVLNLGQAPTALAVGLPNADAAAANAGRLLVLTAIPGTPPATPGQSRVVVAELRNPGTGYTWGPSRTIDVELLDNVASRELSGVWSDEISAIIAPGFVTDEPDLDTPACTLACRAAGAPDDLHLALPSGEACHDAAVDEDLTALGLTPVLDDLDGCAARPSPPRDLGADEAGASGSACY